MNEREFHLCREPWIIVLDNECRTQKVSLLEALCQAEKYRDLAGETESQNIAILRLMLAVLHTVFSRQNENGEDITINSEDEALRRWEAIWKLGKFPEKPIREYFDKWQDRFWLFDPSYPFYQTPGIEGTQMEARKMNGAIAESKNTIQLFSIRTGLSKNRLGYDESARWLIYLQSFDDCAAKNPSPKLCFVANLGIVTARGASLFETLMFNLTLQKDGTSLWGEAKPAWERDAPHTSKEEKMYIPDNQPEILTLQCRRLLLHREGNFVVGYTDAAGEYIEYSKLESAFSEQMTLWETKKNKGVYPKKHDKTRQLWRDFSSLVGVDEDKNRIPGVIAWIRKLQRKKILPKGKFISLQTVGVEYGSNTCGIADAFSDSLELHAGLLDEVGFKWQKHITDEVDRCDKLAKIIGELGQELDRAVGGDGKSAAALSKEQAYHRIDMPFRRWLYQIDPEQDLESKNNHRKKWRQDSKQIIRRLGEELVEEAGTVAIVGRTIKKNGGDKEKHYSSPEAFNRFMYKLRKIDE